MTTCYVYNQNPSSVLDDKSPMEVLFHRQPEYERLKVFGSGCYPCLRAQRNDKLDNKSRPCFFIGYFMTGDSYLCLDPSSRQIFNSRDVAFAEMDFSLNGLLHQGSNSKVGSKVSTTLPVVRVAVILHNGTQQGHKFSKLLLSTMTVLRLQLPVIQSLLRIRFT